MNDACFAKMLPITPGQPWPRPESGQAGTVLVVTRTKERPLLLARACETVLAQSYGNWRMVVVNDGGPPHEVEQCLAPNRHVFGDRLEVIHNPDCQGRQNAANRGLAAGGGEFAVLLDDDDTWHPDFLQECVSFLLAPGNERQGGVACHAKTVKERIENALTLFEGDEDMNSRMQAVSMDQALAEHSIPACSFVFRRAVLEAVGGQSQSLTVLGDWEFLIRCLSVADIGIIPRPLAFRHRRTNLLGTPYANAQDTEQRRKEETLIRNGALRWALSTPSKANGFFFVLNHALGVLSKDVECLNQGLTLLRQEQGKTATRSHVEEILDQRLCVLNECENHLRTISDGLTRQDDTLSNLARLMEESRTTALGQDRRDASVAWHPHLAPAGGVASDKAHGPGPGARGCCP